MTRMTELEKYQTVFFFSRYIIYFYKWRDQKYTDLV